MSNIHLTLLITSFKISILNFTKDFKYFSKIIYLIINNKSKRRPALSACLCCICAFVTKKLVRFPEYNLYFQNRQVPVLSAFLCCIYAFGTRKLLRFLDYNLDFRIDRFRYCKSYCVVYVHLVPEIKFGLQSIEF